MGGSRKISELHGKEEDFTESEDYYRAIFENIEVPILLFNENLSITMANTEFQNLTGYSQKDLKKDLNGQRRLNTIFPDEEVERIESLQDLIVIDPDTAPKNREFKFKRKDGTIGNVLMTMAPVSGTGKIIAFLIDITDHKKTETDLILNQERYKAIVEDQKDMICCFLPDGTLTFVNEAYCKFFGMNKERIIGCNFFEFLSADGSKKIEKFINSTGKENYNETCEGVCKYQDEKLRWIQWKYNVIFKDKDLIDELQASGRDITNIMESKINLEQNGRKFRAIAETAKDAIFLTEISGKIIFCNEAALSLYGYKRVELIGKDVRILLPEKQRDDFRGTFEGTERVGNDDIDRNISNNYETYSLKKNGTKIPVEMSISQWNIDEKVYITVIIRDVTRRMEAEKQIKFQANILENVQDPVIVTDLQGNIIYWNKGSSSLFGYSAEEAMGKTLALICSDKEEQPEKLLKHAMKESVKEHKCKRKDGSTVWVDTRTTRMFDLNGNVQGLLSVSKDVTEYKKIQDEINASLKEKEMLLDEIRSRVRNYMQMLSAHIKFQWDRDNRMDEEVLKDRKNRVESMLLLHDEISKSDDFAIIDFSKYVHELVRNIVSSYSLDKNFIKIEINVKSLLLDIETAAPCGLILNEFIINSIKHAFPDDMDGNIHIDFNRHNNGDYVLTVKDNGVKMEYNDFDGDKWEFKFINTLVNLLNGKLDFKYDNGNVMQVEFTEY